MVKSYINSSIDTDSNIMMKKIAIVHDSLLHIGGAEIVLFALVKRYPLADVYIPLALKEFLPLIKNSGKIETSFLSRLPFIKKYASFLKPFLVFYWESLNLKNYDLIISSSHSFSAKSVNRGKNAQHVSYIHTPPKYLYREFNEMHWIKSFPFNIFFFPIFFLLRKYDYYSAQKPDLLITNSRNVQKRIKKYYNRKSIVIHPPHTEAPAYFKKKKGKYFLFFSRLEKQKGAELVINTCSKFNLPLVVVGTGSQEKYLKSIAGKTVIFKGFISEKEKTEVFSSAIALLYASIDEDYGMIIPEILSYGIPIIAYNSGAIKEFDSKLITTFRDYNLKSLYKAIQQLK